MAFKVTHSWIEDGKDGVKTPHVVYGPYYKKHPVYHDIFGTPDDATPEQIAALDRGEGDRFRLYDDDGNRNYEGIWDGLDGDEDEAFEPLYCYGTPNAGCTRLDYYDKKERRWRTL